MSLRMPWIVVGLFSVAAAAAISAQPTASSPTPPEAPAPAPSAAPSADPPSSGPRTLEDLPPSLRLGIRVAFVQSRMPTTPAVVIVPDERSLVAAIESWDLDGGIRFPILIDDGTWPAQQAIARFVRAFKPKTIVRWSAPDTVPALPAPDQAEAWRLRVARAAAKPWGVAPDDPSEAALAAALKDRWNALRFSPPGIIVTTPGDPAWPAALILSAARGQPILWLAPPGGPTKPDGYLALEHADAFARQIETLTEATGFPWSTLGDDLDALTLCMNCSCKVFVGDPAKGDQRGMLALTDLLGRKTAPPEDKSRKDRWAWAGQIIGTPWQATCAAMSSIFLDPQTAWLFDGYDDGPPWNLWDATEAATIFEQSGIRTVVNDGAARSLDAWRNRTSRGIGFPPSSPRPGEQPVTTVAADLITVNTSGNPDFFELKPGMGRPADVPILAHPAIVHFVHSWSAAAPSDPHTVAGRWLERGAYAYIGSVHEPYLQAFVPTPRFAQRLVVGLPLGAAARLDDGDLWKIAVLGDPLITLARQSGIPRSPTVDRPLPLQDTRSLQDELSSALKSKQFDRAVLTLVLLGRDRDASRLLEAVLREQPDNLSPDGALAGLTSAFFENDLNTLFAAWAKAQPRLADDSANRRDGLWDARDMLWHAAYPRIGRLPRDQAQLLSMAMRDQTIVRDAQEAHACVRAAINPEAAEQVIARALRSATNEADRRKIEALR